MRKYGHPAGEDFFLERTSVSSPIRALIYLSHCALHGRKADPKMLEGVELSKVYDLAVEHSMVAMAAWALEGAVSPEELAPWKEARARAMRRNILLDTERRVICAVMEGWKIWYMPLKGSVLKDLYPSMEMRQMTDQDILFDSTHREKMRTFMLERGYDPKGHHDTHHDIYHKDPVYNIELHHTLFELHCGEQLVEYYRNVKDRMIPDAPGSYGHHFSDEDFYLYMVAHAFKHYNDHGVGLRSFVDVYVYERSKGATMDWDYISRECRKLQMLEYEQQCRTLARKLFDAEQPEPLTEQELEMLRFCVAAGTHGNESAFIDHQICQLRSGGKVTFGVKLRYLMRRLFPSAQWMKQKYKWLRKRPWLLPVAWIHRVFRGVFSKGSHTVKEIRYVMDSEEL